MVFIFLILITFYIYSESGYIVELLYIFSLMGWLKKKIIKNGKLIKIYHSDKVTQHMQKQQQQHCHI